jgi:hypothetical protein
VKDDTARLCSRSLVDLRRCLAVVAFACLATGLLTGCPGDKDKKGKDKVKAKGGKDKDKDKQDARGVQPADVPLRADWGDDSPAPKDRARPEGERFKDKDKAKDKDKGRYDGRDKDKDNPFAEKEKADRKGRPRTGEVARPKDKGKPKTPKVWHREASRPTFARVYVGDKTSLELVSLHVSVTVEGPRARTLVDHVFRNPHDRQLEGTFEYPLPAGASPSYYAMFLGATRDAIPARRFRPQEVTPGKTPIPPESLPPKLLARQVDTADWGRLQEARVVSSEKAAEAYEEVVRGRVDPALLEYASGNTFRGRVFPIAPKGYNRVILAYEETLPVTGSRLLYRFALPGCTLHEMRFTLQADPRQCKDATFLPKDARKESTDALVSFSRTWSDTTPRGEVLFSAKPADATVQATSGKRPDGGPLYLYARLCPELPRVAKEEPFGKHAVFLLDTSLSEHPRRFDVSMQLLKAILEADTDVQHFNVLCFNAGAAWLEPKGWLPNTKAGRAAALARLDGLLLEGATDLSCALEKLIAPGIPLEKGTPMCCFLLSDGHLTWGQTEPGPLVARFRQRCGFPVRFFCYRTGLGEENAELYDALTREGGGVFQCFGAHEVASAAAAHRRQCLEVQSVRFMGAEASEVLVSGRRSAVYPGGELVVAARFPRAGKAKVVLEGRFQGQRFSQSFPLEVKEDGELAARGWGEVAVASLLALNDPWNDDLVTAYCQEFNIASRSASFLVLENEAEYKRFNLDQEKKKTAKGDLGRYLEDSWSLLSREPALKQALGKLLAQIDGRTKVLQNGARLKELLRLLGEEDCAPPASSVRGALVLEKEADSDYLEARKQDRRGVHGYLAECQRRYTDGDADGAVRVLSSVVEEHPGRADALRLVGYRLLDMRRPEVAAQLFTRVLRQRPFEPHSFRDLARSLEDARRHALAALLYEAVLAGTWHNRFGDALKVVTREEHVRLLRSGLREGRLTREQRSFFAKRLEGLAGSEPAADLRVSITWNTDNTDVDLWVIEPDGTRVFYQAPNSASGGRLSADQTQGYGPERYHLARARKGEYKVLVHYFRANPNLLGGETHVQVVLTRYAGTAREKVQRRTVILRREGDQVTVARLTF